MSTNWTIDELLVCYISRQINDDDFVVQGMGTPLVFSAFLLAKQLHSPNVQFMYTVGNTISQNTGKLSLSNVENNTMENALRYISMPQMHVEIVPSLFPKEFMRPAQIDQFGNTNNVAIGEYENPKVRLPGSAGIGDVASFNHNIYYYVTNHDRRSLIENLDFCSSVGYGEKVNELNRMGKVKRGPQELITDKCIFDFSKGTAELISVHPTSSMKEVEENTGFSFTIADSVTETTPPTEEELYLLRGKIDPLQLRKLEFLSGKRRLAHLKMILEAEKELSI
ncbi:CoA-transferase [Neobacillus sp. YX16]|uniref:CoA-transferase n=1 Tax=Neobacillus sp. YX16 TaxID=3047874 RepID=UPI0024C28416|nr:CoA-transferase [Neobacillus sp. YX16]WHZ00887.1 CoA-transferase [Neobacillus sp. YX16]